MEERNVEVQHHEPPNKGQTLAEFALTLPILLLLMFGIVEFGRIFQSWVTLQNAARTAVRYASTGQYKEDRYNIEDIVPCPTSNNFYPPEPFQRAFDRGRGYDPTIVEVFGEGASSTEKSEHLYATWYGDWQGCFPGPDTDQARKDILRIVSIYEEARRGAAGLLLENSQVSPSAQSVEDFLYSSWARPSPDVDARDWFDLVICSSREKIYDDGLTTVGDPDNLEDANDRSRFELITDDADYAPAACLLRERRIEDNPLAVNIPDNYGVPWLDAGGAGDRVTVIITFNHRLITPIGIANMITLQARRSAINESFRVTNAERALGPAGALQPGGVNTPTPAPTSSWTPLPGADTDTPVPTPTSSHTPTGTPEPFNCDNLEVKDITFANNYFTMQFTNYNAEPAYLIKSEIHWEDAKAKMMVDYPDVFLGNMALKSELYWAGNDKTPPTTASIDGTGEGSLFYNPGQRDHNIFVPPDGQTVRWDGAFIGPQFIYNYVEQYDFGGTFFVFDNPTSLLPEEDCIIFFFVPEKPTDTPEPVGYVSPTPTYTPDCASLTIRVEFVDLAPAGDVTLRIINEGPRNAPFTGFFINWPAISGVGLQQVVFGGRTAQDTVINGGTGVILWSYPSANGDSGPNTTSATEGIWQQNVTVPAFSSTLLHLDFTGVSGKLPISPSALNGTRFDIWCGFPGTPFGPGPGGGGGGNGGSIFLSSVDTPVPTNQPPATWTPLAHTYTPTKTPLPVTPSATFTPKPTNTKPPATNTPLATFTPTPPPTNTKIAVGS